MRYKTKPCEIEAVEWKGVENTTEILDWAENKINVRQFDDTFYLSIKTLEREMLANYGDFIIKGLNGEFYPCKPDIFHKKYELITNTH